MCISAGGMDCVGIVMEIWLRIDTFARAAGLKWSGGLGYIAVGVGGRAGLQAFEKSQGKDGRRVEGSGAWC